MKKITQNLTNVKAWQSTIFAFMFLFSLTINAQEVGDEFLANPGVNTTAIDADTGYDASGTFNNNGNGNYGGWTAGTGGAYAAATTANGDCHSPDRMFRLFKTGGTDGQFINQIVTDLPAGNYNYGFWNKWDATSSNDEALPTWSADGDLTPKFTIKVQDATGAWVTVHTHIPSEPTADMTWTEETGTWTNDETRDVRVMFYKNGGTGTAPSNLNNLWYIDTTTLNYASALVTVDCALTVDMVDSYGDGWGAGNYLEISVNGVAIEGSPFTVDTTTNSVSLDTNYGDSVTFNVVGGGSWSSEMEVTIGNTVLGAGDSYTLECIDPDAVYFDASVTTDGAFATFSLTVDNFTVGAAAGEGDGHIHWSIYDSADLETAIASGMIYSTEDVTLPLPNGNHTMVFSLVDPNHNAFDPPIESTVVFSTFDGIYSGDYPYCSSFDTDALDNWSVESVSGDANWTSSAANQNSTVAPLTGAGMAYIYDNASVSNLISPSMDLSSASSASVSFSYTQAAWTPDQDELRVWYRAASGDEWSQIGEYTAEATEWTAVTLDLPNLSATYQVAFNGTAAYGRGITVDDVCIATVEPAYLSLQGIIDFSLPGKYMKGIHLKASADIADLSIYSVEPYASGDRLTPSAVYTLSGSASEGDDLLFWMSNADDAANIYMNASGIFDVVVEESGWNGYNGDDPITLSMNGTVVETFGELGVDGSGLAWEYTDTWAYKVNGTWTHGVVNCTDGSYYTWDSGCVYPLADGQQATGASTDLVTAFSEDMNVVPSGGFWYNETEAPIERKTSSNVPGSDTSAMQYIDSGEFLYSNMQIQFTSKVDMNSMNTFTVDVYVDGTTTTGTAPVNLALKLQDASEDTPWTNQNVVVQDIALDTWTTLTFEFNDAASMSRDDVDRIVVQFNGEGNNDAVTAYMKNMVGSYTEPASTAVTFNVDMSEYGLADGDNVYVNGDFTGWCGDCGYNVMSDDDGDGVYTLTLQLDQGSYFWKYTVNGWAAQEGFSEAIDGCTADNNGNFDRQVVVGAEAIELSYCWNSCEAAGSCTPVEPILMPIDHENESVNYAWNDFGGAATSVIANPDASGINTSANVAQSIKTAGSETWAGTFIVLDEQLDFSNVTTLAVDVWTPDGGELVNLKVENAADGNIVIELNQPTTVAAGWETLYYDLSGGDLSQVYDKIVFFFDFNVGGDDTAYYFDNIRLEAASTVGIDPGCNDFDDGAGDWTVVDAGGLTSDWLIEDTLANGDSGQSFGHGYLPSTAAYNDWLVSPAYNTTGLSAPTLSYYEYLNWSADATAHNVYYSLDYAGDATTATWVLLNDVIGTDAEDTWVQRTFVLPSAENVVVSFQYNSTYGADWNIDDVCIQEDTLSTVDATVLDMRIYPNPSNGSYVTIQTPVNGVKYVEVFDITGKRLINTSLSADTLDVSSISSGMYLVKVTVEGQSKTSKLIIR